jgi:hypothetical protein
MSHLRTIELAQRCADETEKFTRQQQNDPQWCYELLRRALAERDVDAFNYVYRTYEGLVLSWVRRHSRFALTGESADYFAGDAFRSFYFALAGPKFERFSSVAAILSYLKMCVHTSIAQYLRGQERAETVPFAEGVEPSTTPDLGETVTAAEVWQHILGLLPDERDQLLARCVFVLGLKPREICVAYRVHWKDERDVSVALYRIRRVLRADAMLQQFGGVHAT